MMSGGKDEVMSGGKEEVMSGGKEEEPPYYSTPVEAKETDRSSFSGTPGDKVDIYGSQDM